MLHDIEDYIYNCAYCDREPRNDSDFLLAFDGDQLLLQLKPNLAFPKISDVTALGITKDCFQYLFSISNHAFYLATAPVIQMSDHLHYESVQSLRERTPRWLAFAGVTAYHLSYWYDHNRYCGVCATPLSHCSDERALFCPHCGNIKYPDIAVAIIVGIVNGEEILLTRYCSGVYRRYALIAGFVEIGESLYDTVRREVFEEVGLKVKNIRYYDNQPWGFSQSLLVGFFAELDGTRKITLEPKELAEAVWVRREDLNIGPSEISLTRKMMTAYKNHEISI